MIINPIIPLYIIIPILIIIIFYIIISTNNKIIYFLIIINIFIINLKPAIINKNSYKENINILFIIDTTVSMNTKDNNQTRLEQVRKDCLNILETLNNENYSIITFDNEANIILPLTNDITYTKQVIKYIEIIDTKYAQGSSLNTPLPLIEKQLKHQNNNIIIFMSDGETSNDEKLNSYKKLKNKISDGIIIGYGSNNGEYLKNENDEYLTYNNKKIISKINEPNLRRISNYLNINYINTTNKKELKTKLTKIKHHKNKKNNNIELYYLFTIPLLILITIEYKDRKTFI